MCLIVDANVVPAVFAPGISGDFQPVNDALDKRRAVAVYGGKLAREYHAMARFRGILKECDRQGILRKVSDSAVDRRTKTLRKKGACRSDDPHIIALAIESGVRLLCSLDKNLHADFTDPDILKPAGSVYQKPSHRHLIRRHCAGSVWVDGNR